MLSLSRKRTIKKSTLLLMNISPTSKNTPPQNSQNSSPLTSNPNSIKLGKNNNALIRANAAAEQVPTAISDPQAQTQVADAQKFGLNPSNAI